MTWNSLEGQESDRTHTLLVSLFWNGLLDEPISFQEKLSHWPSIEKICKNDGTCMILCIVITIVYEPNGTAV